VGRTASRPARYVTLVGKAIWILKLGSCHSVRRTDVGNCAAKLMIAKVTAAERVRVQLNELPGAFVMLSPNKLGNQVAQLDVGEEVPLDVPLGLAV